jgi:DNA-binding NarL/FixJ family response regulator
MLQDQPGLDVLGEAKDGLEAIQKATELKPDLVLLEIDLPKMNGLEVARRITQVAHNARILFVSQTRDRDVIAAALNDGAYGYV